VTLSPLRPNKFCAARAASVRRSAAIVAADTYREAIVAAVLDTLARITTHPETATDADAQDLASVDLHRHAHLDLLPRAWKLRENITSYDAMYVALAEALDAPFLTCDAPLAKAPGHRATIELIA